MVTAQQMGSKGGKAKSPAKTAAARKNASKPRGKWVTAIAYQLANEPASIAFGVVMANGKPPTDIVKCHEWICKWIRQEGAGIDDCDFRFCELATVSKRV